MMLVERTTAQLFRHLGLADKISDADSRSYSREFAALGMGDIKRPLKFIVRYPDLLNSDIAQLHAFCATYADRTANKQEYKYVHLFMHLLDADLLVKHGTRIEPQLHRIQTTVEHAQQDITDFLHNVSNCVRDVLQQKRDNYQHALNTVQGTTEKPAMPQLSRPVPIDPLFTAIMVAKDAGYSAEEIAVEHMIHIDRVQAVFAYAKANPAEAERRLQTRRKIYRYNKI